ncbi:MAG: hypothetical protein IRY99_24245 [Isosphaeraceae bacterium]|nr:hypothetical protein [Isosphaeraceae bacterium]
MRGAAWIVIIIPGLSAMALAWAEAPASTDFKVAIAIFGAGPKPLNTAEFLVHGDRIYYSDAKSHEILLLDFAERRCELLDLKRHVQARIPFEKLDEYLEALRERMLAEANTLEKEGGKANEVAARMSRNLVEPQLATCFDPKTSRLRMTNPSAEVDATGAAEPDPRRRLVAEVLSTLAKLEAYREPRAVPPFIRLDAITALGERKLRPTELSILFRLAGPPRRARWTYRLVPGLTDRDHIAIARIDRFRREAELLFYADYEHR